jgi:arylsulfatase A-like enzyme
MRVPLIVRYPGKIKPGKTSGSMQSLVDLAPTILSCLDVSIPRTMTGIDQKDVWLGKKSEARDHIVCENHHQPTTVHLKTYVDERYKITVYYNREYGELFDLKNDPKEIRNLWDNPEYKDLKSKLLLKFLWQS